MLWRPADLADARRQARAARAEGADGRWIMGQTWQHLLFAHWPVDPELLRRHVPAEIPLDTFDGSAWIGVTPFIATGVRPRFAPPLPGSARFPEINVRTYATIDGKPGIWFFSLDTPNPLVNEAARRSYRVPYFRSRIELECDGERVSWRSERTQRGAPPAAFEVDYEPLGAEFKASPGSFEQFAAERYCLYVLDRRRRVLRGDIDHPPWPLRKATARIARNTMGAELGADLSGEPVLHLGARQDVVFWWPRPL